MTPSWPFLIGVCLAAIAGPALAQTPAVGVPDRTGSGSADEIALLRQQIVALSTRLEQLEVQSRATSRSAGVPALPVSSPLSAAAAPFSSVDWATGLPEFRSPDGAFAFRPIVRVASDLSMTTGSRFENRNLTGSELRSLRIGGQGRIAGGWTYWVEADFADNSVNVNNAFLSYGRRLAGRDFELSVGQRRNDRGVEGSTPEHLSPFLERSFTTTSIGPERGAQGLGITAKLVGAAWHASVAVTGDEISNGTGDDSVSLMARTHWSPLSTDEGFVHLGAWGFVEDISSATVAITRNNLIGSRFNDNLRLSTGLYAGARSSAGFGLEAGSVQGAGWVMIEAGRRSIDATAGAFDQDVANIAMGWFVTGETPPLSKRTGGWTRPRVLRPVESGGYGALEIVARYDTADYSENPTGGDGDNWALGFNWYPSANTRVSTHWSHWSLTNRTGAFPGKDNGDNLTARVQAAF